jgi:hypothetical protein
MMTELSSDECCSDLEADWPHSLQDSNTVDTFFLYPADPNSITMNVKAALPPETSERISLYSEVTKTTHD